MVRNVQTPSDTDNGDNSRNINRFDPYYKWLGIPSNEQPPNHYRLLGIALFENQREVIRNAADQRMSYVKTYGSGPHSELSQHLLNEISAAKVCLLNAAKKSEYDEELRTRLAPSYSSQKGVVPEDSTVSSIAGTTPRTNGDREASTPPREFFPEIRGRRNTSRPRGKTQTRIRPEKRRTAQIMVAGILAFTVALLLLWRIDGFPALATLFAEGLKPTFMEINSPIKCQVGEAVQVPLQVQDEDDWKGHLQFTIATEVQDEDYSFENGVLLWTPKDQHRGNTYQFKVRVAKAHDEDFSDEITFQVKVLDKGPPTPNTKPSVIASRTERYRTEALGGDGARHWRGGVVVNDSAPEDDYLVGFRLVIAGWIAGIQPVYENSIGGTSAGQHYGRRGATQAIMAPDGYAVGGLVVKAHDAVDGMRVIFMRKQGNSLDPEDTKESRWFGGRGGNPEKELGGTGERIVGIHGRTGDYADYGHFMRCLGLIVERHNQTTSRSKGTSNELDESSDLPKSGPTSTDISADSRKPQYDSNEKDNGNDTVLGICNFWGPPALVRDYGNVHVGAVNEEDANHFFQSQYSAAEAASTVGRASPHAGYRVIAQPATPSVALNRLLQNYRSRESEGHPKAIVGIIGQMDPPQKEVVPGLISFLQTSSNVNPVLEPLDPTLLAIDTLGEIGPDADDALEVLRSKLDEAEIGKAAEPAIAKIQGSD